MSTVDVAYEETGPADAPLRVTGHCIHAMLAVDARRGLRRLLRRHRAHGPARSAGRDPRADARSRPARTRPPEHGERIAPPGARLEVLEDAAHLAVEQPEAVTELIAGHLLA